MCGFSHDKNIESKCILKFIGMFLVVPFPVRKSVHARVLDMRLPQHISGLGRRRRRHFDNDGPMCVSMCLLVGGAIG